MRISHKYRPPSISFPEAAILLVCARNRDLWARLKARQKDGQISLAVETCSFQPQSPTHAQNQTGTKNSWFRFFNRPEPLRFPAAGQTQALGTRLGPPFASCLVKSHHITYIIYFWSFINLVSPGLLTTSLSPTVVGTSFRRPP